MEATMQRIHLTHDFCRNIQPVRGMKEKILFELSKLPKLYTTEKAEDKSIFKVVKLFYPYGEGTWQVFEYDPKEKLAFGMCDLGFPELGYVSIIELFDTIPNLEMDLWYSKNLKELLEG